MKNKWGKRVALMATSTVSSLVPMVTWAAAGSVDILNNANRSNLANTPLGTVLGNLAHALLLLVGILAVIAFAISGIYYLTAAGNEDRMEAGKRGMMYAIIGLVVALAGLIIVNAVNTWLVKENSTF